MKLVVQQHALNIVQGRLAEWAWCTSYQSFLPPEYLLPSQWVPVLGSSYERPLDSRTRTTTSTRFDLKFFRVF